MPVKMSRDWRLKKRTIRHSSFDDDEHIVIKSYYGDYDRQRVLSASTEYRRNEETGEMFIVATLDKLHAVKREIAVMSWVLKDEDGFPLPFTPEVLRQLPSDICSWLDDEINRDWDSVGEPEASKEGAEAQEQQAKEDRSTFQRTGVRADAGAESNGRTHDAEGAGHTGRRSPEAKST